MHSHYILRQWSNKIIRITSNRVPSLDCRSVDSLGLVSGRPLFTNPFSSPFPAANCECIKPGTSSLTAGLNPKNNCSTTEPESNSHLNSRGMAETNPISALLIVIITIICKSILALGVRAMPLPIHGERTLTHTFLIGQFLHWV